MTADVRTPPQNPLWIMVAGPPASGRHKVAAVLADRLDGLVFDLRRYARDHDIAPNLTHERIDPRGEYTDLAVDHVLRDAFLCGGFPAPGRPVLLPGFPETATQLLLLHTVAGIREARMRVVELDAINAVLMARAYHRRLCLPCADDPAGGPHDDALPEQDLPTRCAQCGGRLVVRRSDARDTLFDRLSRFREDRPALFDAARRAGIPWQHLVTVRAATVDAVAGEALRLLAIPRDVALAYPDRGPADSVPAPRSAVEDRP
jgi:adenylate kinase family enzyme